MGMWKTSWETYLKTLRATEEQGDRMLDHMLQQSDVLQEEGKKLVKQWVDNSKKASKSYLDAIEQNIKRMEEILEPKDKKE
jgi:polyhydroxyalkanoate synthesis regulator phasin